jgi:hypothetical protein
MKPSIAALIPLLIAAAPATAAAQEWFLRGDADGNGDLTVTDPVFIFRYLFRGGLAPIGCLDAADVDDDGKISLTDAVDLLAYLFEEGPPPAAPFPVFGGDATEDDLSCEVVRIPPGEQVLVLCLDRSSSMGGEKWKSLEEAVEGEIRALPPKSSFAVILFDQGLVVFPGNKQTVLATGAMREAAISLVQSTTAGAGSCGKPALILALQMALATPTAMKRIVFYSDGPQYCNGQDEDIYEKSLLAEVAARNTGRVRIDAVCIGSENTDVTFLMALASANGGTYTNQ